MSKTKKFGWILFGLIIIVNVVFFPFLPARMAIRFNTHGVSRTVSKPIALAAVPLIMLVLNLIHGNDENKDSKIILGGIILFAVNIVNNIINMLIF